MYLTQGLHRSVQQTPHETALVGDGTAYTFAELVGRVSRLASALLGLGATRGDRIGILSANSSQYVEYALACPWAGLVLAPVNSRWSAAEMAYQIADADIAVLLVDGPSLPRARALRERCTVLTTLVGIDGAAEGGVVGYEDLIAASLPVDDSRIAGDALAAILYTGGTTGEPKGVMVSPSGLLTSVLGGMASTGMVNDRERFLHVAPLYHLAALGSVFGAVVVGSTHHVLPEFTVEALAAVIEREQISGTTLVPTMIQRLFDHAERTGCDLTSLRNLGYGASPIHESVLRQVQRIHPDLQLCQRYGMTELCPVATVLRPEDHRDEHHPERLRSAGRAALHAEVRVVDADDTELPTRSIGEIVVRGANLMLGYWKRPAETAEALRGGWMHTGDVGFLDESGYLYIVDRLKDMIVTGAENVYSAEVERVLAQHPAIASCAVIGVPDPDWGERVHAVVVLRPGADCTAEQVREFCAGHIARYKAPRSVDFVPALPLSPVGKILKRALREQYAGGREAVRT